MCGVLLFFNYPLQIKDQLFKVEPDYKKGRNSLETQGETSSRKDKSKEKLPDEQPRSKTPTQSKKTEVSPKSSEKHISIPRIPPFLSDYVELLNYKDSLIVVIINNFKIHKGDPKIPYLFRFDFAYCIYLEEWGDNIYVIDIGHPNLPIRQFGGNLEQRVENTIYLLLRFLNYSGCYIENDILSDFPSFVSVSDPRNNKFTLVKLAKE